MVLDFEQCWASDFRYTDLYSGKTKQKDKGLSEISQ